MIRSFELRRLSAGYKMLLQAVIRDGDLIRSRVGDTMEVVGFNLQLHEPCECVVRREGFNKKLLEVECAMILAGVFDEDLVRMTTPKVADLVGAQTAYGPRIRDQIGLVADELTEHPESRRGVLYIGHAKDLWSVRADDPDVKGEMPCTECIQFIQRDHQLHACVSMRSWDLVWGLSYDVPMFVSLQMAMAKHLGCHVGKYYHFAGSAHVYDRHWDLQVDDNHSHGRLDIPFLGDDLTETSLGARAWIEKRKRKLERKVEA